MVDGPDAGMLVAEVGAWVPAPKNPDSSPRKAQLAPARNMSRERISGDHLDFSEDDGTAGEAAAISPVAGPDAAGVWMIEVADGVFVD